MAKVNIVEKAYTNDYRIGFLRPSGTYFTKVYQNWSAKQLGEFIANHAVYGKGIRIVLVENIEREAGK